MWIGCMANDINRKMDSFIVDSRCYMCIMALWFNSVFFLSFISFFLFIKVIDAIKNDFRFVLYIFYVNLECLCICSLPSSTNVNECGFVGVNIRIILAFTDNSEFEVDFWLILWKLKVDGTKMTSIKLQFLIYKLRFDFLVSFSICYQLPHCNMSLFLFFSLPFCVNWMSINKKKFPT